ncbi:LysR substrate-binding domain-containing protein [Conchiformibius kuhniae]|uniref:LysR substrate-binding domain-containing protein n=1 Tax=Conchiformibius kuhniae TaxID=211502 RepID=A0ABD8B840_9NEIS|nr:LysR substrate-binding domain-containing protein [Conchiformibius kuhniae]
MKLQQLRYAVETFRHNLNVSEAAEALFTSQPGVSKQIKLLEEEIGVRIFIRHGKRMVAVTQAGRAVLETAERILRDVQHIKSIGGEFADTAGGVLTVAASHTHARCVLPPLAAAFAADHPDVCLNIITGTPDEVAAAVLRGEADFAVSSEPPRNIPPLRHLLSRPWRYALLLPKTHTLAEKSGASIRDLSDYPLLTYNYALQPHSVFGRALAKAQIHCRAALLSCDNDLLKTYVRAGLGIGLLDWAACAAEARDNGEWTVRDISHWFEPAYTQIIVRGDTQLRKYACDLIARIDENLTAPRIESLLYAPPADDFSI